MNILLLGSGGREHALAWKIKQSTRLTKLYVAPGNAGTAQIAVNVDLNIKEFGEIHDFCLDKHIDMIVVGPEEPLVNGINDFFAKLSGGKIMVVGPCQGAAILEGSKDFAKQFMKKYKIPTAAYRSFTKNTFNAALNFIKSLSPPYVLKADGLASGKGVVICSSFEQAQEELELMLLRSKFGDAGKCVVIEEFLKGVELSVFIATDGNDYKILPHAKDYKKIGENDKGLNTGGMGAVSPAPFVDNSLMNRIVELIIEPTMQGLKAENISYQGFIFFGLMISDGLPYVIEYNARLGDPETEVVIPLLKTDIIDLFEAICCNKLKSIEVEWATHFATTVMLVSHGYPGDYQRGLPISVPENTNEECLLFHSGTCLSHEGQILTNGGRVMAVTCLDVDLQASLNKCYKNIKQVNFEGMYFRKDIGNDMLKYIKR